MPKLALSIKYDNVFSEFSFSSESDGIDFHLSESPQSVTFEIAEEFDEDYPEESEYFFRIAMLKDYDLDDGRQGNDTIEIIALLEPKMLEVLISLMEQVLGKNSSKQNDMEKSHFKEIKEIKIPE